MKKIVSLVVCSLLLGSLVCFVGCGSNVDVSEVAFAQSGAGAPAISLDATLAGRWLVEGKERDFPLSCMDLLKDGTGLLDPYRHVPSSGDRLDWRAENGRLYLFFTDGACVFNYKISGTTLTLTDVADESTTYKKQ
jgi:hypothetical protein